MRPSAALRTILAGCAVAATLLTGLSEAAPVGPAYDPASVSVRGGGADTTVTQTTSRAVVDWSGFDVRSHETVTFVQPAPGSAILNRVHSPSASRIDGAIAAPGQVIIQNSNGVVFGSGARIDVGSLVATTLQADERAFRDSGRLVLGNPANSDAEVRNGGRITASDGGTVALVGSRVVNTGVIRARLGTVALASGAAATIDFDGDGLVQIAITDPVTRAPNGAGAAVGNSGRISADGGSVLMTANAAAGVLSQAINLTGIVEARGVGERSGHVALLGGASGTVAVAPGARIDVSGPSGGSAIVSGENVMLAGGSRVDASGQSSGGAIRIGGDYRGGAAVPHARQTEVQAGAVLDASGRGASGGSIVVWSDRKTDFAGQALAGAAGPGGIGGLVETSSAGTLTVARAAEVSTRSPGGRDGTWLLDPDSIAIVASGGTASSPAAANAATGASSIDAATLVAALASNQVNLIADSLITVDAPVIATALGGSPRGLQLITAGPGSQIRVNAPILLQDGNLALRAEGDILLGTVGSTETDFNRRAIIAVGSGTVWMQTRATGNIVQADNSAVFAENLALTAGSVSLGSPDNFTLNLAGSARNGTFLFREANASGTPNIGTVVDPFVAQSLAGVVQRTATLLESQTFVATNSAFSSPVPDNTDQTITLALSGGLAGQTFDAVVFSGDPYRQRPGGPAAPDPA
ncbi:MAG: filamentous hemagglutinin N-terminal domain-containing protein [Rhizomicrobium sp.]